MDTTEAITHISLCAGYGGIDIGLKRCMPTLRTILVSEIEAYAVANLVAKMEAGELDPCPIWTDLKTLPLDSIPENISILSGGFPCQPFSQAGKREGDEDPRHLFPYIKNAIRTIQPRIVFLENVEGIISAKLKGDGWEDPAGTPVLLHVLRELERVGYSATAGVFSAAEVGATHQRKRVFILAHSGSTRSTVRLPEPQQWKEGDAEVSDYRSYRNWPARPGQAQQEWEEPRVVGNAKDERTLAGRGSRKSVCESGFQATKNKRREGEAEQRDVGHNSDYSSEEPRVVADAHSNESASIRGDNGEVSEVSTEQGQEHCAVVSRGEGEERGDMADADSDRLQKCSVPDEQGAEDHKVDGQSKRQTESELGGATDGPTSGLDPTANRVDRLRLLGNGVVPDTVEVAFRTLYKELMDEQQSNQS